MTVFLVGFCVVLVLDFGVDFTVAFAVALALGFDVGLLVAANAVLVEAIIAPATIIESRRPFIRDSI